MTAGKNRWTLIVSLALVVFAVGLAQTVSAGADVANADIYEVRWSRSCPDGGPNCDFGHKVFICDAGDKLIGAHAQRTEISTSLVFANLNYGFKGLPANGAKVNVTFIPDGQKAIVTLFCANTTP